MDEGEAAEAEADGGDEAYIDVVAPRPRSSGVDEAGVDDGPPSEIPDGRVSARAGEVDGGHGEAASTSGRAVRAPGGIQSARGGAVVREAG